MSETPLITCLLLSVVLTGCAMPSQKEIENQASNTAFLLDANASCLRHAFNPEGDR